MNLLCSEKFLAKWDKYITITPTLNIRNLILELAEFMIEPSWDELGDVFFMLGIKNPWSFRKIIWRGTYITQRCKLARTRCLRLKGMRSYIEKSTKDDRQTIYRKSVDISIYDRLYGKKYLAYCIDGGKYDNFTENSRTTI